MASTTPDSVVRGESGFWKYRENAALLICRRYQQFSTVTQLDMNAMFAKPCAKAQEL